MSVVKVPIILIPELGEQGLLADGATINAGGIAGPHFHVAGKALIFADGTATDGSGQVIVTGTTTIQNVMAYEHVQALAASTWSILHAKNTRKLQVTIWDDTDELVYADVVRIVDYDHVEVLFNTPISGRAILMLF
jgi:hypothetical protein